MTLPSTSSLPSENLQRGVIFALIALPVGVIAWDILWGFGFVASIVAFAVAYLAFRLYRFGSGGRITRNGAIAVAIITIGTLIIAFISGFAVEFVGLYSQQYGTSIPEALVSPDFWSIVFRAITSPEALPSLALAALFGALGCFGTLRAAFRQSRVPTTAAAPGIDGGDPAVPAPPAAPSGMVLNGEPLPPAAGPGSGSGSDEATDKQ
jgi:hypothetical protein